MRPTTGTHIYTLLKCRRNVALDLAGDRELRRPKRAEEEFLLKRGRDHEASIVGELGWPEPRFERGDFVAGAAATEALLRSGVEGVSQGVLTSDDRLGIPDLMRREPGASSFGDFHYVIGDIKSSSAPRSDQILQVLFYTEMLAELQGREPEYGYLVLKDGREERFAIHDFAPALQQVLREIAVIRADPAAVRPFRVRGCERCVWSPVCDTELLDHDDLSLLPGMTRALRTSLERAGFASCSALADATVDAVAASARLELAFVRRLQRAAVARARSAAIPEDRSSARASEGAVVHMLSDGFADRVLWIGVVGRDGVVHDVMPESVDEELSAFQSLVSELPTTDRLLHYGAALPRWFEERAAFGAESLRIEQRFVDLGRRLRAAATLPGIAFGLADHVRLVLGRDPHRAGRSDEAAMRAVLGQRDWLVAKGRSDLEDMVALRDALLGRVEVEP